MRKHFFTLILALFAGMGAAWAQDYDFSAVCSTGQTLYYKIIDADAHTAMLTAPYLNWFGFTEPVGDIVLPEMVEYNDVNYSVTEINDDTFNGCEGLTGSLNIPNSIIKIGDYAFYGCDGLVGSLTIGNSVTEFGNFAFWGCSGFTGSLVIGNSVTTIGEGAFQECSGFNGSLSIGNSVKKISNAAFYLCSGFTGSLTIGDSVNEIGDLAFDGCSGFTGSLCIPNSVVKIGISAFNGCSGFSGSLSIGNSLSEIAENAFDSCSGFTNLTIGNSVSTIGNNAFYGCSGFKGTLIIPNSVSTIGNNAFSGCSGFDGSLYFGKSVTHVGSNAFMDCNGFSGTLSFNSVIHFDIFPFGNFGGFSSIISKTSTPPIMYFGTFITMYDTIPVYVPCGCSETYCQATAWDQFTNFQEFKPYDIYLFSSDETMGIVSFAQLPDCEAGICKVKASPKPGYKFDYWMENGAQVSTDAEYSFEATADRTLTAYFSTPQNVNSFAEPEIQLFPNPANDVLNVVCDGMRHVTIMNTLGQVVYDAEPADVQSAQISLSGFDAGVYIVRITTDNGMISESVVKAEF